jgi:hypothetical protein
LRIFECQLAIATRKRKKRNQHQFLDIREKHDSEEWDTQHYRKTGGNCYITGAPFKKKKAQP